MHTVASSDAALDTLAAHSFQLIVSDIGMPGGDGYALIKEVRTRGLRVPAIALTAFAGDEDRKRALDAGFDEHVSKPVDVDELCAAVDRLVGDRQPA